MLLVGQVQEKYSVNPDWVVGLSSQPAGSAFDPVLLLSVIQPRGRREFGGQGGGQRLTMQFIRPSYLSHGQNTMRPLNRSRPVFPDPHLQPLDTFPHPHRRVTSHCPVWPLALGKVPHSAVGLWAEVEVALH